MKLASGFAGSEADSVGVPAGVVSRSVFCAGAVAFQRPSIPGHRCGHECRTGRHPAALHHHERPLPGTFHPLWSLRAATHCSQRCPLLLLCANDLPELWCCVQGGIAQLLQNNQAGAASQSLQAVLPTFQPLIKQAGRALGIPDDSEAPPATPPAEAHSPTSRAARATQRRNSSPRRQSAAQRSATRAARSLPSIDPSSVPSQPIVPTNARSSTPGIRSTFNSGAGNSAHGNNGNVLARVADTGAALMSRLPAKHRDSQVAKIATSLLQEIREFSANPHNNNGGSIGRVSHGMDHGRSSNLPSGRLLGEGRALQRSSGYDRARAYSGPAAQVKTLAEISSEST